MGEREVTEIVEVVEEEELHLCDFCGRDEEDMENEFHDVEINPELSLTRMMTYDSWKVSKDDTVTKVPGWNNSEVYSEKEQTLHLCEECYTAYTEVINDAR